MATSTSWAQDVLTCDLCDKAAQQFCNSCQVSLCESCVKKHRDELWSLPHDIVPFLDRKIQIVFPECQEHSGQRCEVNYKDYQGKELIIEIGGYRATMKQMSPPSPSTNVSHLTTGIGKLMYQVRIIATIPTNYKPLYGVACEGEAEAWIFGNETITRIDIHGALRDTVSTTCLTRPEGISVTRGKELIYSDMISRTVNIVRHRKSETLITAPQGWVPWTLCCTGSGDILVHVYKWIDFQRKNKIIRYQGKNIKKGINKDGQGNRILKDGGNPLFMSENNNGDVCVSDCNAGTVVVVDKTGRVRFRYNGTPTRRKKSFAPRYIVTDALSQIIVADIYNNCLHILDQNGQFLRCGDDCGLEKPYGLSVDSEGRLWVGLYNTGEIKVIQYLEQS
uniref:Uncharacterized protein LOC111113784 n=1 Tax=Crassostrea virginica TaxID=6565 RepID=A0A8B8BWN6_CRAVI|nr:uncharacterized protein LOC111113784 [Crassostrea virginica]